MAETDRGTGVQRDWPFGSYLEAKLCLARPDADIHALPLSRLLPEPPGASAHRAETAA
jgi:hypothetical protein